MSRLHLVLLFALGLLTAACSSKGAQDAATPTLRVADQIKTLQSTLGAAGEDKPTAYRIEWSNFLGGPAVIAAETGGSIDLGWMAETPLVFAQAAGSPIKVIAVSTAARPGASSLAVVVSAKSSIKSVRDLKGHSVGFMPGTIMQYLVVRALEKAGLSLADITPINVTGGASGLLTRGTVDAIATADPQLSQMLAEGKIRVIQAGGEPLTPEFRYLVASKAALEDPKRAAALRDFVTRTARATRWERENIDKAAPQAARAYNIPLPIAVAMLRRTPRKYVPIDAHVIASHQAESNTFLRLGLIRNPTKAAALFDDRFNAVIAAEEKAK